MKRYIDINDGLNELKQITTDEMPLCVSNCLLSKDKETLLISSVNDESNSKNTIYAYIAQDEGHLFFQPNNELLEENNIRIFHNDEHIEKSAWLKSGDVLQINNKIIDYKVSGDKIQFKVTDKLSIDIKKEPTIIPPPTPHVNDKFDDSSNKDKFSNEVHKSDSKKIKKNTLIGISLILILMACFVLFAETATIKTEPMYDDIKLTGIFPTIKINKRFILISGEYDLSVTKKDYETINKNLKIDSNNKDFSFSLKEKPGLIEFKIKPENNNKIYINKALISKVDNMQNNVTSHQYEIDRGQHQIVIENPRYKAFEQLIKVEGKNQFQRFEFELEPNWGNLKITTATEDVKIEIHSASNPKEITEMDNNKIELIAGQYTIKFNKDKYKESIKNITIKAGDTINLEIAELIPEDAKLNINSTPSDSLIRIDDQFYGKTPQLITLSPNIEHEIKLSLSGYKDFNQKLKLDADELSEQNYVLEKVKGLVFISVIPETAELYIDGIKQKSVSGKFNLSGNNHTIQVKAKGYTSQTKKINANSYSKNLNFKLKKIKKSKSKILTVKNQSNKNTTVKKKNSDYTNSIGQKMILVKPAQFDMGSKKNEAGRGSNERLHKVKLSYSYFLSDKEISNKQFKKFKASHNSGVVSGASLNKNHQPVVNVNWNEAAKFANWLSKKEGFERYYKEINQQMVHNTSSEKNNGYRLPYESEWVLAARGQSQKKYSWVGTFPPSNMAGNFADESSSAYVSNIIEGYNDQNGVSAFIGTYSKNTMGFYDLGGNVSEWCQDYYSPNYGLSGVGNKIIVNPQGPEKGIHKVVKDSSWRDASITELRLSYRSYSKKKAKDIGFRLARNAQ